ncbi:MAG: 50S ribosomal protein L28 [Spirochaetes bacterium GWF1_49_6]|nr:MAG: 50S ribosomal protein L28 [Spirochaetes bacterium GWF1_49_6]
MSRKCDLCAKGPVTGNSVSHSHKKTRTRWVPNLRSINAIIDGKEKKIKICMDCLSAGKVNISYHRKKASTEIG